MTIGLVLDDTLDHSDGVQQAVVAIGEELRSRGHRVHYIVSDTARIDLKNIHSIGSSFALQFNGNSVRTPKPTSKHVIEELFEDIAFDVLHVQMPFSPFMSAKVLELAPKNVKKFGTFHILPYNFSARFGTKLLGRAMRKTIQGMNNHFAVSEPAKKFMDSAFNTNGIVIPNPVDYTFYANRSKKSVNAKKTIVFIGRFESRKGVRQLVRAYEMLKTKGVQLIMCGDGPLHAEIVAYAKERKLAIEFPGFVNEEAKANYLAKADIAVFPSVSGESFGIVLTEAMSAHAGIVLGGNNPGYASVLQAWPETLFKPNDIKEFATNLDVFLQDDALRLKIGDRQHKAAKQYDINSVVDKLLLHYNS